MNDAPGYDPDLDNVAISPRARCAQRRSSGSTTSGSVGEFEPVGTRPEFQRRGLGKAVLLRGLAKMRERGMTTAIVGTNAYEHRGDRTLRVGGLQHRQPRNIVRTHVLINRRLTRLGSPASPVQSPHDG